MADEDSQNQNILQDLERDQEPELLVRNCLCEHHRRELLRSLNQDYTEDPVNQQVSTEEEEKEQTAPLEAQNEEVKQKPVYNSIRERYASVLQKEKQQQRESQRQATESNTIENSSAPRNIDVQAEVHGPFELLNQATELSQNAASMPLPSQDLQNPVQAFQDEPEDERDAQGIIQLLSSQLLSQILSAGDLFHSHIAERFEREVETMKQKFYSLWFENILKVRIFLSDRHEKVERALQKCGFLPKNEEKTEEKDSEQFDIEVVDLEALECSLNDEAVLKQIYEYIMNDDENYD